MCSMFSRRSLRNFLRTTSSERMLIYQTLGLLVFLAVGIYSQDGRLSNVSDSGKFSP